VLDACLLPVPDLRNSKEVEVISQINWLKGAGLVRCRTKSWAGRVLLVHRKPAKVPAKIGESSHTAAEPDEIFALVR